MKISSHYHTFVFVCLFSFILTVSRDAVAANRYWDAGGGTNTDWSTTNNWSGDTEPTSVDNAYIGDNSAVTNATATISQAGEVCTNLYLGNQAGTTGTVTMSSGELKVLNSYQAMYIGNYGVGSFTQNGGVVSNVLHVTLGYYSGGTGTYALNGGDFLAAGALELGRIGSGTFVQETGTTCDLGSLYLSSSSDSVGTYTMNGGDLTVGGDLYMLYEGSGGNATFVQEPGSTVSVVGTLYGGNGGGNSSYFMTNATLTADALHLANNANCTSIFEIAGGQLEILGAGTPLRVGNSGVASFTQNGGVVSNAGGTALGYNAGSTGTYTLSEGDFLTAGGLELGRSGSGTFVQEPGTTCNVGGGIWLCEFSDTVGTYIMNGGDLTVGDDIQMLYQPTNGNVTFVQGPGSTVTVSGALKCGYGGAWAGTTTYTMSGGVVTVTGELTVREGSNVTSTLQGWGLVKPMAAFQMSGMTIADGYGVDHDLTITNYTSFAQDTANAISETNGWYARNHGRLVLKDIAVSGSGTNYWGDTATPDLINAVKLDLSGVSGSGPLSGTLYASDHGDVPAYAPSSKIAGIWKFETNNFSFSSADMTFRYDHAKAAELGIVESDLKAYHHLAGKWEQLTPYSVDTNANTITASNVTSFSCFAVGEDIHSPIRGTAFMIN